MRIVLIEDQILLRDTLIKALAQTRDIELAGHSDRASDVIELCKEHKPDVVLMDVFTKDGNGIDYTKLLKESFPDIKVFIMTGVEDDNLVKAAEKAGADIFLWKNLSLDELVSFIQNADMPYRIFPRLRSESLPVKLSKTDISILGLLALGKSSEEIAAEMYLTTGTVRVYISRMYTETGAKSRAQLVAYGLQNGLIAGK